MIIAEIVVKKSLAKLCEGLSVETPSLCRSQSPNAHPVSIPDGMESYRPSNLVPLVV